jgi:polyphenol oxidase
MAIVEGTLGPRARWAFADRSSGASVAPYDRGNLADHVGDDPDHVRANRATLAAALGLDADHVVAMAPVHGRAVGVVTASTSSPVGDVDALVTTVPGVALLTLAADCVPVLLADGAGAVVAVAHAGWRGVQLDVVGATVEAMLGLGAEPGRLHAVVGPAICGACYAVPRERFDAVVSVAPSAAAVCRDGQPGLDLRAAVLDRLRRSEVSVRVHGGCTLESASWFSHRRDGVTGRHGGIATLHAGRIEA